MRFAPRYDSHLWRTWTGKQSFMVSITLFCRMNLSIHSATFVRALTLRPGRHEERAGNHLAKWRTCQVARRRYEFGHGKLGHGWSSKSLYDWRAAFVGGRACDTSNG